MIKKLQALRAKKGFTLVELIVVIAIIGVLAAILVPTMMGMVTKSRVTSANTTAKGISDAVQQVLTEADTAGQGMLKGKTSNSRIEISVATNAGSGGGNAWTIKVSNNAAFKKADTQWPSTAVTVTSATKKTEANQLQKLGLELMERFPTMAEGAAVVWVSAGTPVLTVYTADATSVGALSGEVPAAVGDGSSAPFTAPADFVWDEKTAGISKTKGFTVGTAPEIPLGTSSTAYTST